jgi:serine/threonine protein kinase
MPTLPLVGQDFAGYRLRAVLGRGGMSVVYEAENTRLGNTVALKVLAPELATNDAFRARFLKESRLAASLNHPNVIPIYDTGPCDDLLYIAMRHVAGSDLRTVLNKQERLSPSQALLLVGQAGRALDAAHRAGLVHRDVKPANVLIERGAEGDPDHVYLSDFGLTKHQLSRSGLTGTGELLGTIDYIAPEQIQGKDVDGRADIYSLGCVLYECLTGRVPFVKDVDAAVIWAHVEELPTPPSAIRPGLGDGIDGVIMSALAKDPADRYPTCREFLGAAQGALEPEGQVSAPRASDAIIATGPPTVLSGPGVDEPPPTSPPPTSPPPVGPPTVISAPSVQPPAASVPPAAAAAAGTPSGSRAEGGGSAPHRYEPSPGAVGPDAEPVGALESDGPPPAAYSPTSAVQPAAAPPPTSAGPPASPPPPASVQPLASASQPPADPPPPVQRAPGPPGGPREDRGGGRPSRRPWYALALVALAGAAAAFLLLSSSSSTQAGEKSSAGLEQVPTNHVTGSGDATVRIDGSRATVTVTTTGLDNNDSLGHLMHIHAGGKGECPPVSAARLHNGHLTISTTDGLNYYGPAVVSLTTGGDFSPRSILAFPRYLTGGTLAYKRTIPLPPSVAEDIRRNNAVVVIHGVDYDGTGIYSGVLDRSELNKGVPATATAPALCGVLVGKQQTASLHPGRARQSVFTATLVASSVPPSEWFLCGGGEATAAFEATRRRALSGAAA